MPVVTIRFSDEELAKLEALAVVLHVPKSQAVRRAVRLAYAMKDEDRARKGMTTISAAAEEWWRECKEAAVRLGVPDELLRPEFRTVKGTDSP
jgi:hypothetical protein